MRATRAQPWTLFCLIASVICGGGAVTCFWQYARLQPEPLRLSIGADSLRRADGLAYVWTIPWRYRIYWPRAEVRLLEAGQPLPYRLEEPAWVSTMGDGRFCLTKDRLWLAARDNRNPNLSGASYELEIINSSSWPTIVGIILALLTGVFLGIAPPVWRRVGWLGRRILEPETDRRRVLWSLGWVWVIVGLLLMGILPRWGLRRTVAISAGGFFHYPAGGYTFNLPKWVRHDPERLSGLVFLEDRQALSRRDASNWLEQKTVPGYAVGKDSLRFRATDLSNPLFGPHRYSLQIPVFTPQLVYRLFALCFGMGLILLAHGVFSPGASAPPASWQRVFWRSAILGIFLGKLFLIAGDEIAASESDAQNYATAAVRLAGDEPAGDLPLHPAGVSWLAGLVGLGGVPWRIGLECLYVAVVYRLIKGIMELLASPLIGLVLFALLVWHPWTLVGFREFMAEPIILLLLLTVFGIVMRLLATPSRQWKWRWFLGLGGCFALWNISRHEDLLVLASYGLVAIVILIWQAKTPATGRVSKRHLAAFLLVPLGIVLILASTIKLVNYWRFGVYARSWIQAPGLMSLMGALYHIKPEQDIRYAPVTRQSLRAACEASPTLRPYADPLLDPHNLFVAGGEGITQRPGEFGPYLNWLLPSAIKGNLGMVNATMRQAAQEIKTALQQGKLERRPAIFPFDPGWRHWGPDWLPCSMKCLRQGAFFWCHYDPSGSTRAARVEHLFDLAANRRAAFTHPYSLLLDGWIQGAANLVDSVALMDSRECLLGATTVFSQADGRLAFGLRLAQDQPPGNCHLAFFRRGQRCDLTAIAGTEDPIVIPAMPAARDIRPSANRGQSLEKNLTLSDSGKTVGVSLRWSWASNHRQARRIWWENWLEFFYPALACLAWVSMILSLWGHRQAREHEWAILGLCGLLGFGWILSRALFYGLIEAMVGWMSTRYMACLAPVYMVVLTLGLLSLAGGYFGRYGEGRPGSILDPSKRPSFERDAKGG